MGWAIGFDREHDRWRGYGVPAYCDATGCDEEIDRGFGYTCEGTECDRPGEDGEDGVGCWDLDEVDRSIFVCSEHTCRDVDESNLREHPRWIEHMLTDASWEQWRQENPERVRAYRSP